MCEGHTKHGITREKYVYVDEGRVQYEDNRQRKRLCLSSTLLPPDITLLGDGELGTLALGQRYPGLGALTNDEDVGDTR